MLFKLSVWFNLQGEAGEPAVNLPGNKGDRGIPGQSGIPVSIPNPNTIAEYWLSPVHTSCGR